MLYDNSRNANAEVSELADEQDSGSCERYAREGSSPFFRIAKGDTFDTISMGCIAFFTGGNLWQNM